MINNLMSFLSVLVSIKNVILALVILLIMITIHEFGHYIVGKLFKFKINEFAIGMGPAIYKKKKKNGEIFSIRLLPLGGFCAFSGEDEDNEDPNAFNNKKPWQRILVLIAGAFMNFILSLVVIMLMLGVYGQSTFQAYEVINTNLEQEYLDNSLKSGDSIISILNGNKNTEIFMSTDFVTALNHSKKGDEVKVKVMRDGKILSNRITVKLRRDVECKNITEITSCFDALGIATLPQITSRNQSNEWLKSGDYLLKFNDGESKIPLGEEVNSSNIYKYSTRIYTLDDVVDKAKSLIVGDKLSLYINRNNEIIPLEKTIDEEWNEINKDNKQAVLQYFSIKDSNNYYRTSNKYVRFGFFDTIGRGFQYSFVLGGTIFRTLGQLLTGKLGINAMGGTITTIATTSKIVGYGFEYFLEIMAYIGVNLAVFNLLPIPALDGSRVVFCLIEWIRKKPINRNVEAVIHFVGLIIIIGFALLVDILQFI